MSSFLTILGDMRRLLLLAAFLILLLAMAVNCDYCKKSCKSASGLTIHLKACSTRRIQEHRGVEAARRARRVKKIRASSPKGNGTSQQVQAEESDDEDHREWMRDLFKPSVSVRFNLGFIRYPSAEYVLWSLMDSGPDI